MSEVAEWVCVIHDEAPLECIRDLVPHGARDSRITAPRRVSTASFQSPKAYMVPLTSDSAESM